jgi:sec-independent protein translocase protein TatA
LGGFVNLALIPYVPSVGGTELIILLVILLLLFGAKRIPELAKGLGSGIREFKRGMRDEEELLEEKESGELTVGEDTHNARMQEEAARAERQS